MSFEINKRVVGGTMVLALGVFAMANRGTDYEGWSGCTQAELTPRAQTPRRAIVAEIKDLNHGAEQLNNGSVSWEDGTTKTALAAIGQVYEQAYGSNKTMFQIHDMLPFCMNEQGVITLDLGGQIVANGSIYERTDGVWQLASESE
jgi:hypothetical protein